MNFEQALAQALGFKELELIKANETIRILQEEIHALRNPEPVQETTEESQS